jgi:peptidoglycan biosynthesis protein MviN/MurJ (putative lipid II flippase)
MVIRRPFVRFWPSFAASFATLIGLGSCGYTMPPLALPWAIVTATAIAGCLFAGLLLALRWRAAAHDRHRAIARAAWSGLLTTVAVALLAGDWFDRELGKPGSGMTPDHGVTVFLVMIGVVLGGVFFVTFAVIGRMAWVLGDESHRRDARKPPGPR